MKHLLLAIFCFSFSATISAQKVDTVLQEEWKNNAWQNAIRIITDYNADCQPGTVLIQNWNATSGQWENSVRTTYTYTGGTYVSQAVSQTWDKNSSSWKNNVQVVRQLKTGKGHNQQRDDKYRNSEPFFFPGSKLLQA